MNKRIDTKYTKDAAVWINSHADGKQVGFHCEDRITIHGADFDREGLIALRDAINCYLDTGEFSALLPTDPRPFVGKVMRYFGNEVIVTEHGEGIARLKYKNDVGKSPGRLFTVKIADLLPLTPPAPKMRPLTIAEWATKMDAYEKVLFDGETWSIHSIYITHVRLFRGPGNWAVDVTFGSLLEHGKFGDGSPCGIVEEPKA